MNEYMEENNITDSNEQPKKCDGHCETCNINQRTYCAAQMAYYNQQEIASIKAILERFGNRDEQGIILRGKNDKNEIQRETAGAEQASN